MCGDGGASSYDSSDFFSALQVGSNFVSASPQLPSLGWGGSIHCICTQIIELMLVVSGLVEGIAIRRFQESRSVWWSVI